MRRASSQIRTMPGSARVHALLRDFPRKGIPMASSTCQLCDKKPWFGKQVSHSHRRSSKRWNPNIQRVKAYVDGKTVKLDVCTSCIKAGKVTRPPVKA